LKYYCPYYEYNCFRQRYTDMNGIQPDFEGYPDGGYRPYNFVAPDTVKSYIGSNITTYIDGYGNVRAHVISYDDATGMANLILLTPSGQKYIQVHH